MSKAKTLANTVSTGGVLADGTVAADEVSGLAAVATSGAAADVSGLATVATSGDFTDLINKPGASDYLPDQTGQGGKFLTTNGTAASWDQVDMAADVTGTLPVANGGTGATSLTGVLKGNGTGAVTASDVNLASEVTGTLPVANGGTGLTSPGTAGNVLVSDGTGFVSQAPSGGAWELLETVNASSASTVEFSQFSSTYDYYQIISPNVKSGSSNAEINLRVNLGSGFITASGSYYFILTNFFETNTGTASTGPIGNYGDYGNPIAINISRNVTTLSMFAYHYNPARWNNGARVYGVAMNSGAPTGAITGIQLLVTTLTGTLYLYGLKKS